jgi:type IV secretory pathway TrbL component
LSTIVGFDLAFIIIACALSRNAIVEAASNEESDVAIDADAPIGAAAVAAAGAAAAAAGSAAGGRTHERTTHASRLKTVAATAAAAKAAGGGVGDRGSNSGYKKPEGNGQ